jgi:hypothetical protein
LTLLKNASTKPSLSFIDKVDNELKVIEAMKVPINTIIATERIFNPYVPNFAPSDYRENHDTVSEGILVLE